MSNYQRYSQEFKDQAVALVLDSGLTLKKAAADLGMSPTTLQRWVSQARVDGGQKEGLTSDEKAELARLKRENRILREEREILKKAAVWFARESETR